MFLILKFKRMENELDVYGVNKMAKTVLPISIIIPTLNRPIALQRTINELMSSEYIPSQIIVIDQSENKMNQKLNKQALRICDDISATYHYQEPPSSTKARNTGLDLCRNDIVIFSDDDVDVNHDTLINVFRLLSNQKIAMIAGIDENMGISKTMLGYIFGVKSFRKRNIGHVTESIHGTYPNKVTGQVNTQWAMGYFFVCRKSLINKWGIRWDETLTSYAYAEDLDFTYSYYKKAAEENLACVLNDMVKVKHMVSREFRVTSYHSTLMYVMNREYLSYKHYKSIRSRLATRWANIGEFLSRIIKKNHPFYLIKAQFYCDKYRKDIKKGILHTELYQSKEDKKGRE